MTKYKKERTSPLVNIYVCMPLCQAVQKCKFLSFPALTPECQSVIKFSPKDPISADKVSIYCEYPYHV